MIVQVRAPHFTAALIVENEVCVRAAPILRWAIGKGSAELRRYFAAQGWMAVIVPDRPAIDQS